MDARRDARGDAGRDARVNEPDAPAGDTGPLPDGARRDAGMDVEEIPADCMDGVQNGSETDVDCGGACPRCIPGARCAGFLDCLSSVCMGGVCVAPACDDGVRNGDESDVDCGGSCTLCADGGMCAAPADCSSGVCTDGVCVTPTCTDAARNGTETDVDCGGSCPACPDGRMCAGGLDCASGACMAGTCRAPSCADGVRNGTETDVDCGASCPPCLNGRTCTLDADCSSGICIGGVCTAPSCSDGRRNGGESDVDCGGATACTRCANGRTCGASSDCASSTCTGGVCAVPGVTFVGFVGWTQNATSQTDAQQDAIMNSTCNASFPGSRAATTDEMVYRRVIGMPGTNTSGSWLIPACPNCEGDAHAGCASGHARNCLPAGEAFPSTLPWTALRFCHTTARTAMCVR